MGTARAMATTPPADHVSRTTCTTCTAVHLTSIQRHIGQCWRGTACVSARHRWCAVAEEPEPAATTTTTTRSGDSQSEGTEVAGAAVDAAGGKPGKRQRPQGTPRRTPFTLDEVANLRASVAAHQGSSRIWATILNGDRRAWSVQARHRGLLACLH